jgi:exopolysaccharide production protein ExoQ
MSTAPSTTTGQPAKGTRGEPRNPTRTPGATRGSLSEADRERLRFPTWIASGVFVLASLSRIVTPQTAFGGLALLSILHHLAYRSDYRRARMSLVMGSYALLCLASILWSVDRATTIHRMPAFVSFYIIAMLIGPALGLEQLCAVFTRCTRLFVVAALVAGFAFPEWAKDPGIPGETGWASIVASKNYLGLLGVLCFASCVLAPRARNRILWAAVSVLVVVQSRSATSMALLLVSVGSALFSLTVQQFRSVRKQRAMVAILATGAAMAGAFVLLDPKFAAGLLGRDSTLTGRTAIWDFVWRRILERPWLGHGYQAYWNVENAFTVDIKRTVGFPVTSAHQGLLDVLLSVGVVGAILTVILLGSAILRTFGDRSVPRRAAADPGLLRWARGIVLIYAIETFSESCLTTVFVVPLLMVVSAITSQTTFFRRRFEPNR